MNSVQNSQKDPIRKNFFGPLEKAENASGILFVMGAILSFASILVDQEAYPVFHTIVSYLFIITIIVFFVLSITIRLYWFPRAEDARRKDFLSNTFGFDLTNQRTTGYYSNDEKTPERRMALSVLENLLYTKTILQHMATLARAKAAICLLIWMILLVYRDSTMILITTIALTLFSEEILARWLRLEWALNRGEKLFESTHRLLQSNPSQEKLFPYILDAFADYETGKSLAGILLSGKIFNKINPKLSREWEEIKSGLFQ